MLRWIEGFDIDYGANNMARKYDQYNAVSVAPGTPRLGSGFAAYAVGATFRTPGGLGAGAVRTLVVGMAILPANVGSDQKICQLCDPDNSDAEQVSLWKTNGVSGKTRFVIKRGTTVLGTASLDVTYGFWCYVEFMATADTGASDGSVQLRINQTTVINVTGISTRNSTGLHYDKVQWFLTTASGSWGIDDMYVLDDQGGGSNTAFLGDRAVEGRLPNGSGGTAQWTPKSGGAGSNYLQVQEQQIDDDASYNSIATDDVGKIDLFTIAALSVITGPINGVQLTHSYRVDSSGEGGVRLKFQNPTPTVASGPDHDVTATDHYQWFTEMYEQDPTISSAWTVTNFNAMKFGYESRTPV